MTANKKTFLLKHCLKFFSNTVSLFVRMRNICCRNKMFLKKFRNILNIFLFLGNKKCFRKNVAFSHKNRETVRLSLPLCVSWFAWDPPQHIVDRTSRGVSVRPLFSPRSLHCGSCIEDHGHIETPTTGD